MQNMNNEYFSSYTLFISTVHGQLSTYILNLGTEKKKRTVYMLLHEKTYLLICTPDETLNQPAHLPNPIGVLFVHMMKFCILDYPTCH